MRNPVVLVGSAILLLVLLMGIAAPLLTPLDPAEINPAFRNRAPGAEATMRGPARLPPRISSLHRRMTAKSPPMSRTPVTRFAM